MRSLTFTVLVLLGLFNHPDICWRNNPTGHKHCKRFLEYISDNFLTQNIEQLTRRDYLLVLILNKGGFVEGMKVRGSLGCSYKRWRIS